MGNWKIIRPERTVNLIANPSFETGTTGWSTAGSNTIAQSTDESKFGSYSLKCTYQDATTLAEYTITLPTQNTTYALSVWVYVPADWGSDTITIDGASFASSSEVTDSTVDVFDQWIQLVATVTVATDVSGSFRILATAPTAGKFIYIDAVQVEEKSYSTTYCDGDQDGCIWNGARHASTSTRRWFATSGGRVLDLEDDVGFTVEDEFGHGLPPMSLLSSPLPKLPGSIYEGRTIGERTITLRGSITADDKEDYHDKRSAIIRAFGAESGRIADEAIARRLRYTGDVIEKEIDVVYAGGLEGNAVIGFAEQSIDVKLVAHDPYFYEIGNHSAVLAANDDGDTYRGIAARIDGIWTNLGVSAHTTFSVVRAIVAVGDYIYFGGTFTGFSGVSGADNIVRYNKTTGAFSAMDAGTNGAVSALAIGPKGTIYVGGAFTEVGSGPTTVNGIAVWSPVSNAWSALGPPSSGGTVTDIGIHPTTGDVYVVGAFTNWDGNADADRVAFWDGSAWDDVGSGGANSVVRAIVFAPNGDYYIGGDFTTITGVSANRVAQWSDEAAAFLPLAEGVTGGVVNDLVLAANGLLYVGGSFTTAGGWATINRLAEWNGVSWARVHRQGVNDEIRSLAFDSRGILHLAGDFTSVGPTDSGNGLASWNGSTYSIFDLKVDPNPDIYIVAFDAHDQLRSGRNTQDDLYIGFNDDDPTTLVAGNTSITYTGTANAYLTITVERDGGTSATLESIRLPHTGARLMFDHYDLLDGERLTITLHPLRFSMESSIKGNVYNRMLPQSNKGQFYLTPRFDNGSTTNVITCFVDVEGAPTITAFATWKNAYESTDG